MAFLEKSVPLLVSDTEIYQCPALLSGSVHGLIFSNLTETNQTIRLKLHSQLTGVTTAVTSATQVVPANAQFTWPKPINMVSGDKIIASCGASAVVIAVVSAYLDTTTNLVSGIVPRGQWTNVATYTKGDAASFDGSSYLAVVDNINSSPPALTNWMMLARRGATFAIGAVTTGIAGSAATVTNVGTSQDAVLDFRVPQGLPGGVLSINGAIGVIEKVVFETPVDNIAYVQRNGDWVETGFFVSQFKFS